MRLPSLLTLVPALALALGCATHASNSRSANAPLEGGVAKTRVEAEQPPGGIGRTDDGGVHGPYGEGAVKVQAYKSTEAGGSVNSWLLVGEKSVALIDSQLILSEARKVVEMIQATGKPLAWVWITHAHPDHNTGLVEVAKAFPDAKRLAHPRTVEAAPKLFEGYKKPLNKFFPGDIPETLAPLTPHEGGLELEGLKLEVLTFEEGEHEFSTALHAPAMRALFCADLVYSRVHPWLNEMHIDGVLAHVERLRGLDVDTFYPGHGEPVGKDYLDTYKGYVDFFLTQVPEAKDSGDLVARVWREYKDWRSLAGLRFSAGAALKARDAAQETP